MAARDSRGGSGFAGRIGADGEDKAPAFGGVGAQKRSRRPGCWGTFVTRGGKGQARHHLGFVGGFLSRFGSDRGGSFVSLGTTPGWAKKPSSICSSPQSKKNRGAHADYGGAKPNLSNNPASGGPISENRGLWISLPFHGHGMVSAGRGNPAACFQQKRRGNIGRSRASLRFDFWDRWRSAAIIRQKSMENPRAMMGPFRTEVPPAKKKKRAGLLSSGIGTKKKGGGAWKKLAPPILGQRPLGPHTSPLGLGRSGLALCGAELPVLGGPVKPSFRSGVAKDLEGDEKKNLRVWFKIVSAGAPQ